MPPTSRTLAAALRGECQLSPGAAADYGYSAILYKQQKRVTPNSEDLELLSKTYAIAVEMYGDSWLHTQLRDKRLRDTLSKLTDYRHNFDWVAFMNE